MRQKLADYNSALSNPGKNKAQDNNVNSVAKKVALSFEAADDHLMSKKNALNKESLAYTSEIKNRLG